MEYLEIHWRPEDSGNDEDADEADDGPERADEARAQIARIHELMEGTATYRALSGGSGIVAGAIGLAACALSWAILAPWGGALPAAGALEPAAARLLAIVWGAAFVLAAAAEVTLTKRAARRRGEACFHFPRGSPLLRRMRLAYAAPLYVGGALTLGLARAGDLAAIPAVWLLSYGAAVVCAGLFSTKPVRRLGAAFLALGGAAAVAPALSLPLLAAGFGAAHIVYGVHVWRSER